MSLRDRQSFFEDLAIIISEKPYSEIIETIVNGVYALDAYQHWLDNKNIYDRLSYQGLMIYVIKKSPFNNLPNDSLDSLIAYAPHIEDNLKAIEDFDVNKSNTLFFLKKLREELNHKPHKENLSKAGYLQRWFERFDLGFDILRGITIYDLEQALKEKPVEVLAEVLRSVYTYKPDVYAEFYEKNKDELLCKLQIETETLTADIKNQALEIRYFVEYEVNAGVNVKKQSVNRVEIRVEIFANCLPLIHEFDVAGLYFPSPQLTLYLKHDDSILKTTQSGSLQFDDFVTTANQAWLDTILQVYEFSTQYEWENYWVEYRRKLLMWCQHTCKILEYITSIPKLNTELILWEKSKSAVYAHKKTERSLRYDEYFPKTEVASEIKNIEEWHRAVENVLNQTFPELDNEHAWHVYKLNARDIKAKLSSMQDAFNIICQKTAHFFEVNELIKQEKSTYDYLADLIEFVYDEAYKKQAFTNHIKQDVKAWKEGKRQDILTNLKIVKDEFELETFFQLILPSNIVYEGGFTKSIVLGINNITPKEFDVFIGSIIKGLLGLINLDVDFYYLILIDRDGKAMRRGIKFNHDFFQETIDVLEGRKIEIENIPLPLELEDIHFEQLGNIEKVEQQPYDKVKSAIIIIHELLWQFTEIHHSLTTKNVNIQKWLQKLLASVDIKLMHQLSLLKPELEVYQKYETIIQEVRLRKRDFDKEACYQYWQEDMVL